MTCRASCAAWCVRTSRSTIPRRRWRATLRLLVRERIAAGDSDNQVIDFLVARYGEFVLLKPRFNPHTLVLWLLPPLALVGGGLALWTYSRRRSKFPDTEDQGLLNLTAEEEARLERLIAEETSPESRPEHPPIATGPFRAKTSG